MIERKGGIMPNMRDCPGCGVSNSVRREGCFNCGALLPGASREVSPPGEDAGRQQSIPRGDAPVAALVLGIASLFFVGIPVFAPTLAILGIVFARRSSGGSNPGMATAALICSIIALVLSVAWIPVYFIILRQSMSFGP